MKKHLDNTYYILLAICLVIIALPIKAVVGVYSPTILGWIWILFLVPVTMILFLILTVGDFKRKRYLRLLFRFLALVVTILIGVAYIHFRN